MNNASPTGPSGAALGAMYRTCAYPGCQVGFDACRIHHVHWWEKLGPTALDNRLPLCSVHHHLVHEGGWSLTLRPDRTITLHRPDGTLFYEGSTLDRITPPAPAVMSPTPPPIAKSGPHLSRPPPCATAV